MDKKQIEMLVCPECNAKLNYEKSAQQLVCNNCKIVFPVEDGIPVMLIEQATKLEQNES